MTSQYVFPSSRGLFRIVRHGHRWRALIEARELARHDTAEAALGALRLAWPQAKLPPYLSQWRYLAEPYALPHARLTRATASSRSTAAEANSSHVRRSRRTLGRSNRDVPDHG
ncbi:hypothetical protein [Dyella acidiphila]|uniref:Uncharacterized protein n=1 Tax=Dyella acidiphila TaxID=2775866 RepID=A0ABR9G420_9GAMM|nr:hypothetical protein [Dyella acidiphila]MBE1158796.1 hypothetical protein [Dyella acidiphila]